MKFTFLGHACLSIEVNEYRILVDPFISGNPNASAIDITTLNPHYILITHAHQDHVLDVETIANQSGATLISNFEIIDYYAKKGIENGHPMNTGGKWTFPFGTVHAVVAHHSSSFADGSNGGSPNGYVIETEQKRAYIAGDTALTYDMKLIPELIGAIDVAVLPIGDNFTMDVRQAILAADFVQCNHVLGYHYDTFGYIEIDHQEAMQQMKTANKELRLLSIGESMEL